MSDIELAAVVIIPVAAAGLMAWLGRRFIPIDPRSSCRIVWVGRDG
jgi:hypothetical protein